ncbi:hypothetical protein SLS62_010591 [Diatrype stigma]|uniref:Uncharacterized protein n=1 Tax=Diatrype stigma TaxID=117547 RepID=A0AAN9U9E7_9PEZI
MYTSSATMEFIGINYANRGICVRKPATWEGFLQTVSQRFGLSSTVVASLRVLYCDDMSSSSPRWEIDASAWPIVGPKSCLYLEVNDGTQHDDGIQDDDGEQAAPTSSTDKKYINVFIGGCQGSTQLPPMHQY